MRRIGGTAARPDLPWALVIAAASLLVQDFAGAQSYPHPWVIGHRGGTVLRPENTLLTYDYSLGHGATGVEFDVWLSSDGFPVCHHDYTVDRTTDGTGPITQKTLAEILMLDAGSWFGSGLFAGTPVPRFEEGLQLVASQGGKLLLDIKDIDYIPTLVAAIEATGFPKDDVWVWNRFGTGIPFEALMPEAHIVTEMSPLVDREWRIYQRMMLGEDAIDETYNFLDRDYADLVHSYGVLVMTHTVVSPRFQEQIDLGVDIVVASHPTGFAAQFLPGPDPECIDGIDNDGDGLTDFPDDPSCWGNEDDAEYAACSDGIDNDGDGLTDFPDDPGCFDAFYTIEDPECSDGIDNNGDGLIDYPDDAGCFALFDQGEQPACANGLDDDGDGLADYPADPGCFSVSSTTERPECNDGLDNDGDGQTDHPSDSGCQAKYDISESAAFQPACNDALDNDGDGLIDHPADPECLGPNDDTEAAECNDGIDNDSDGLADAEDPDCLAPTDPTEQTECRNGLDDDGDGLIDFPSDGTCLNANGAAEAQSVGTPAFGAGTVVLVLGMLTAALHALGRPPRMRALRRGHRARRRAPSGPEGLGNQSEAARGAGEGPVDRS